MHLPPCGREDVAQLRTIKSKAWMSSSGTAVLWIACDSAVRKLPPVRNHQHNHQVNTVWRCSSVSLLCLRGNSGIISLPSITKRFHMSNFPLTGFCIQSLAAIARSPNRDPAQSRRGQDLDPWTPRHQSSHKSCVLLGGAS